MVVRPVEMGAPSLLNYIPELPEQTVDHRFRSLWDALKANGEKAEASRKEQEEAMAPELREAKLGYLLHSALLSEIIAFCNEDQSSRKSSIQASLRSAVELGLEAAVTIQSLTLGGTPARHKDVDGMDPEFDENHTPKRRRSFETDGMDMGEYKLFWGGPRRGMLGLTKQQILESTFRDHRQPGPELVAEVSGRFRERAEEIHVWCREDGMESCEGSLQDRHDCCLNYLRLKRDAVVTGRIALDKIQQEILSELAKCHSIRMEIFEGAERIVDYAAEGNVEYEKRKVEYYKDFIEVESSQSEAVKSEIEAGTYTAHVNRALEVIHRKLESEINKTTEQLKEVESNLQQREGLGQEYNRIAEEYSKVKAMIASAESCMADFEQIEEELDEA
ncbi:hypothetical protein BSKO_08827 [Bryopsis sp. KO-2023]|nr:hypothetical protein BSKO_08827 [Bryopsis sp. KO-2023]